MASDHPSALVQATARDTYFSQATPRFLRRHLCDWGEKEEKEEGTPKALKGTEGMHSCHVLWDFNSQSTHKLLRMLHYRISLLGCGHPPKLQVLRPHLPPLYC